MSCRRKGAPWRAFLSLLLLTACTQGGGHRTTEGAQAIRPLAPPGLPADSFPSPDRPVARIVTDTWSDEASRDSAREAEDVMRLLDIGPGMRVADVGAGSGYYAVRLAPRVGPGGQVIAQDIVPRYLERLRSRIEREGLSNVTLALGDPHDPRLPVSSVDLVLLVHMYHEIEQPYGLLYNLRPALRPGARVAVVDLDRSTASHGTPPALLRCEFARVGYREVGFYPLREGYLAVFAPTGDVVRVVPARISACAA